MFSRLGYREGSHLVALTIHKPRSLKRVTAAALLAACLVGCSTTSHQPVWVAVKYRSTLVDVNTYSLEPLGRADSSLVTAAWYDDGNDYLLINLQGTNNHYCGFPGSAWRALTEAPSMGRYYTSRIKGSYDCLFGYVPSYSD